ncbi:hypothetical protein PACILC2_17030 [Paenibacillus cisolokensis]|uniref:HTH lacI-type domain-containing protein n=1 Tax=Paenibacillus cisolokensis TaxID=1658519 RepID=A0ABQ4N4M5_9BACL|nr:LacI family DNA-binding transcriptional regulator [Paenibacillus cisolokensis]GIQ63135.1 hypothetical protein PACILC2_17030 [Paenibacillus cisolokensis]
MIGLKEIAKLAGVSVSTVSNVLNGRKTSDRRHGNGCCKYVRNTATWKRREKRRNRKK